MSIFSSSLTITGATGGRGLLASIGSGEGLRGASFLAGDDFLLSTTSFLLSLFLRMGDLLLPLLLLLELPLCDDEPLEDECDDPLLLELLLLLEL